MFLFAAPRLELLVAIGLLALAGPLQAADDSARQEPGAARPNIVLIMADYK